MVDTVSSSHHSGAQDMIGYDIDLTGGAGAARVTLDVAPRHLNRNGSVHGGIVAMMLDSAAGFAAALSDGNEIPRHLVTLSLNTQFLGAATSGRIIATGTFKGGGKTTKFADSALHDEEGRLLATGTGVFRIINREKQP